MPTSQISFLVALSLPAVIAAAPVLPPSQQDIAEWVRELGSKEFAKRERAQRKLWEAGKAAEAALREAVKGDDPETRRRAGEILEQFRWGLYPDTPKKIADSIKEYQAAERTRKLEIVRQLFDEGGNGLAALVRISGAEENPDIRRELNQTLSREAGRAIPRMLAERNHAVLEQLLDITLTTDRDVSVPNYVAYYLLRGKLDERIVHFQKLLTDEREKLRAQELLFFLYRAKGDVPAARKMAEELKKPDWVVGLLEQNALWAEAAKIDAPHLDREIETLAYRAAYHRLAGNRKEFDDTVTAIKRFADNKNLDPTGWQAAKALFLNDRPEDALGLIEKGHGTANKAEILAAQLRYKEALDTITNFDIPGGGRQPGVIDVIQARLSYFLGDKDKAKKRLAELGEMIQMGADQSWFETLVDTEVRLGLREQAHEHAAKALALSNNAFGQMRLLRRLYPGREETAQVWWTILRGKQASEQSAVTMKSLRNLLDGKLKGQEVTRLIADAEPQAAALRGEDARRFFQALAAVALQDEQEALARRLFEKAAEAGPTAAPLIRWGDYLAEKKRWEQAADAYASAWEKDRRQALPLYLRGWALKQAGQTKDAETLMEQAHWVPLGDEFIRLDFARELAGRGFHQDAKRTREILLRTCAVTSFQAGEAMRLNGVEAMNQGDYLKAADWHERATLRVLRANVNFNEAPAYVGVPSFCHRTRARGFIAAGKLEEAKREIDVALAATPGSVELVSQVVPELEKHGHQKEADQLFERVRAILANLVKEHPNSAGLHNSLAWACASCRRDLETAQKHAEKAVELEPASAGYRDTLAEALFQRGRKDEAIAHMKKCLEAEPKRVYYQKQMARFEAGDTKAPLPDENQ